MVEKLAVTRTREDNRTGVAAQEVESPRVLNVKNLRQALWQTLEDTRLGNISVLQAAVIARLAMALLTTYRVAPESIVPADELGI